MKVASEKATFWILFLTGFCAVAYFLFSNVISYWTGYGTSHITRREVDGLTFVRDDRFKVSGVNSPYQEVKIYRTPEGNEIAVFQTGAAAQAKVFVRFSRDIFKDNRYERITTYEPFVVWIYLLVRLAALFVLSLMILALVGLILKLMGKGSNKMPLPGKES